MSSKNRYDDIPAHSRSVILEEWELGIIGNGKGDALETRNYKGLKLTDMILELLKLSISTTKIFLQSF